MKIRWKRTLLWAMVLTFTQLGIAFATVGAMHGLIGPMVPVHFRVYVLAVILAVSNGFLMHASDRGWK